MSPRPELPVLDLAPSPVATPRPAIRPADQLAEFATEALVQPTFHVWTLGCQMNASDSEEMAGALLAAGCREAPRLEDAELIIINTCSIRETAEQKVIGRMGLLRGLKDANPGLRVVLTGCSVRADNESVLQRRYPAVDLFLRPDEEPELTARLGLVGPTAPGQLAAPAFQRVGRSLAAVADRLPGTPRGGGGGGAHRTGPRGPCLAPHHLRLRQDLHVLHRALRAWAGTQPALRRPHGRSLVARGRRLPRDHAAWPERQLLGP